MMLETIRILANGLGDPDLGVNVQLQSVPICTGDKRPDKVKKILDITRSKQAVELQRTGTEAGPDWPVIVVLGPEEVIWKGEVNTTIRDTRGFPVTMFYITKDVDDDLAVCASAYTMRAMVMCLRQLEQNQYQVSKRSLNGINVISLNNITTSLISFRLKNGSLISGMVRVEAFVRDVTP